MQYTRAGIPVNVPKGFKKSMKVQIVKKEKRLFVHNPHTDFAELTREVDGLEETIIGPVGTKEYTRALKQGFTVVNQWQRKQIKF